MKKTVLHGGPGSTPPPLSRVSFSLPLFVVSFLCSAGEMQAVPDQTPSILRDRIDAAADMLKDEPTLHAFSKERRRETIQFVVGNLLFVLLHEMGHVQVTEMGLPVLGREEDAADSYAAVKMLALKDAFSDRVLTEAARGWFYSDRRDRMEGVPIAFYDSHGLSHSVPTRLSATWSGRIQGNSHILPKRQAFRKIVGGPAEAISTMLTGRGRNFC